MLHQTSRLEGSQGSPICGESTKTGQKVRIFLNTANQYTDDSSWNVNIAALCLPERGLSYVELPWIGQVNFCIVSEVQAYWLITNTLLVHL